MRGDDDEWTPPARACGACDIATYLSNRDEDVTQKKLAIRNWLDAGPLASKAFWLQVASSNGLRVDDWVFIADPKLVEAILRDDKHFSVCEYDRRMRATSGSFYLGMDPPQHDRDAAMGAIIPSWNQYPPKCEPDVAALQSIIETADAACADALGKAGMLGVLAKLTDPDARCRMTFPQLFGPVLDACASKEFGLAGPSSLSFVAWAKELTWYHFRVYANDGADRACARDASGQYAAHVKAAIATMNDAPADPRKDKLREKVTQLREHCPCASDEDVTRALTNILTGALTATTKAFSDALYLYARQQGGRFVWPELADSEPPEFPLYEQIVAQTLSELRRGALDSVYRTFVGTSAQLQGTSLELHKGDRVIVWLGGSLTQDRDNLFGIGLHKCPGMDMAKAMIEGALRALVRLTQARPPTLEREDEVDYVVFAKPELLLPQNQP
jgi:cytochrome P450